MVGELWVWFGCGLGGVDSCFGVIFMLLLVFGFWVL